SFATTTSTKLASAPRSKGAKRSSMALTRCSLVTVAALLVQLFFFLAGPAAAAGQVTVFWGRNKDEGSLREACDTGLYTMVVMSFLNVYGHGDYRLDLSGHPVSDIGGDVKHCQRKGVLVSLAIGGPGGAYSLPTNQSALGLFDHLWNTYLGGGGGGSRRSSVARPFGDAVLDGVDFILEHATPAERYDVLAAGLAKRSSVSGGRPLHLTATTRCAFPDRGAGRALATGAFERVHVRFYGDGGGNCTLYWEDAWDRWTAAYPRSRVYFGLPAAPPEQGGRSGYIYPKTLYYSYVPALQKAANYGGFVLWDRYSDKQSGYSSYVHSWA
ncbi:xylanase inhibitor protein 1-like, partial [Oryza brachyantha]|uniref:xylanase inhibitor protein 1-like n=1 Tax=Oryza brachyantha TaxID=4533 RepID=UPI001ADC1ABC